MSDVKKDQVTKVVKFLMMDKKLIKFMDDEQQYTLSEKVAKFDHAKYGVKTGIKVDVSINGTEVTYLRKSEVQDAPKEEKKPEPQPESKKETPAPTPAPEVKGDAVRVTIGGISGDRAVISFKELAEKVRWYIVPEDLKTQDWEKLGLRARAVVDVTFTTVKVKDEDKPAVKTMVAVEAPKEVGQPDNVTDSAAKDVNPEKSAGRTERRDVVGESIERQCALKAAGMVVAAMLEHGTETVNTPEKIKTLLREIAEEGIRFIKG